MAAATHMSIRIRLPLAALAYAVLASMPNGACAAEPAPPHERLTLVSRVLGETRRLNVYLPPVYDEDQSARFPVLYMPDGGESEDFPHVAATADLLIRAGAVRPFVVVGIENTVRRRDMTGPTQAPEDLKVTAEPGGAPSFRRFLATELMPAVSGRYRVTEEAAIIGESLAGLFVVDTLLREPGLFDVYIAIDPSLWWNQRGAMRDAPQLIAAMGETRPRLLLTAGGSESNAADVEAFTGVLEKAGAEAFIWTYLPRPDLRHDNIYRRMEEPLLSAAFGHDGPASK